MSEHAPEPAPAPELTALEEALRRLAPAPAALDRDRLLFRAGQAAAPRRWFWPAATAVSTATASVLAVLLACRPAPVVERIVPVPVERPAPAPLGEGPNDPEDSSVPPEARTPGGLVSQRQLEEHLLRRGLDGLGEPPPPPDPGPANSLFPQLSGGRDS
jgi:hypothetical protein